jgi:hypothetical protein
MACLDDQEIPRLLWIQKVHYRVHKSPPPTPVLSQVNPLHSPRTHFRKIHFSIVLPFTPRYMKQAHSSSVVWPVGRTVSGVFVVSERNRKEQHSYITSRIAAGDTWTWRQQQVVCFE